MSPQSGRLAVFGEADAFVVSDAKAALKDGLELDGRSHQVQVLLRDSQSSPMRARRAADDLINQQVDLVLAGSTLETTAPVADQCEANGVPCLSTGTPYQSWYYAREGTDPARTPEPFRWTWHFFWGMEDAIGVFGDMWGQLSTNQVLGVLWPDDRDGRVWSDARNGLPAFLRPQGYRIGDPGRYREGADDFTPWVDRLKRLGAEIVTGVVTPADFATFWRAAGQRGLRPKIVTVAKALGFPAFLEAMGDATGLSTEVGWSPGHPYRSSLTGSSSARLAEAYSGATGRQWIQPLGFGHALLEVAVDAFRRAGVADDRQALAEAIRTTDLDTVVGRLAWTTGQADLPNVARTPLVGGQWRGGRRWPLELTVVANAAHPEIPATGTLQPLDAS